MENNKKVLLEEIGRIKKLMSLFEQSNIEQQVSEENPDIYAPVTVLPPDSLGGDITKINKKPEGLENSKRIENELIAINGYKDLMTHLRNSTYINSYSIWFKTLNQETRKKMIELFNTKLNELKSEVRKLDEYEVIIKKGKQRSEDLPPTELEDLPPINLEFQMVGNDVFVDNKSDITPSIQSKIDELVNNIKSTLDLMNTNPDQKITLKVNSFSIGASASRFRNTEEAADLTWAELSSLRSEKVKIEIYRKLEELGVITSNGTIEVKGGWNGDGTSGPNPGLNPEGKQYAISKDGTYDNYYRTVTKEIRNQYGKPHNTKEEYDKYKWIMVSITLVGVIEQKPNPEEGKIYFKEYTLEISPKKDIGTYRFPTRVRIKFDLFKKQEKKKKVKEKLTKCPNFDNDIVKNRYKWWKKQPVGGGA